MILSRAPPARPYKILDATTEIVKPTAATAVLTAAEFSEMTRADETECEAWLDTVDGMPTTFFAAVALHREPFWKRLDRFDAIPHQSPRLVARLGRPLPRGARPQRPGHQPRRVPRNRP